MIYYSKQDLWLVSLVIATTLLPLLLVIDRVKSRPNATELLTSVVREKGSPQGFYEKLGFKLTGEYEEDD